MEEDLRAALRADLAGERPPPLGDVVGVAISQGRRIRRNRRLAVGGAAVAVLAAVAFAAFGPGPQLPLLPSALPPGSVPSIAVPPAAVVPTRTVTVRNGTQRAEGMQKKATSAAMLHLLTTLLPPGRTSHYGDGGDNDLRVQLYYDAGYGPSMLRLQVTRKATGAPRGPAAKLTVTHVPDDCVQDTAVRATWPDGTAVQLDIASCLASGGRTGPPAKAQLSEAEAVLIVADRRWGVTMDADLVDQAATEFPTALPVFGR
ncbi:hypothetical protein ACIA5C_08390 [Actinoplanes sp. NPDC051343]|uniref:hypothetical protein n=1 Tax=Actinoplanes sp. NPDC051343 TaxID=3363906 RepID=UPI0037AFA9E2